MASFKLHWLNQKSRLMLVSGCDLLQNLYDNRPSMEFQTEIKTLACVEHLNLVKFYGYLEYEDEKIIVVEYVPNGTLREHLDCKFLLRIFHFVLLL